jgi:hypothetical protein
MLGRGAGGLGGRGEESLVISEESICGWKGVGVGEAKGLGVIVGGKGVGTTWVWFNSPTAAQPVKVKDRSERSKRGDVKVERRRIFALYLESGSLLPMAR